MKIKMNPKIYFNKEEKHALLRFDQIMEELEKEEEILPFPVQQAFMAITDYFSELSNLYDGIDAPEDM